MKTIYKLIVLTCTLALFASCSEPKLQVTGDPEKDLATYVQLLDKDAEAAEVFINDCAATYEQKIANDSELAVKFVDSWLKTYQGLLSTDEAKANAFDAQFFKFSYIE